MTGLSLGIPMLLPIFARVEQFTDLFILGFYLAQNVFAGIRFGAFFGDEYNSTESETQNHLDFDYKVKKVTVTIGVNSSNNIFEISMRDDGFEVPNTLISVPSATTGKFDSGDIDELIVKSSLTNLRFNRTGGTTISNISVDIEAFK